MIKPEPDLDLLRVFFLNLYPTLFLIGPYKTRHIRVGPNRVPAGLAKIAIPTCSSLFLSFHWASLIIMIFSYCWANFPFILPFLRPKTHLFHSHRPGSSLFHHLLYILSFLAGWDFLTSMGLGLDHILDLNSL